MANPQKENGHILIANEIEDALCRFRIPGEVAQVVHCVIRKTYGYGKKEDWISCSQLVKMTGMNKQNINRALSKAIGHKLILKKNNKLGLNKNYEQWISFKSSSKVITGKTNSSSKVITQSSKVITRHESALGVSQSDYSESSSKVITPVIQSDYKTSSKVTDTKDNKDNIQKTIKIFLAFWKETYHKDYRTLGEKNFRFWLSIYTLAEMQEAVAKIKYHPYWKDKDISPTWFFRRRNKHGEVDYIGEMLNLDVKEPEFIAGTKEHFMAEFQKQKINQGL